MRIVFVHASADGVLLEKATQRVVLEPAQLEVQMPKVLLERWREEEFDGCFVLNGPGSFTTLRVVCLSLNVLQFLTGSPLRFWSCSKMELYDFCFKKGLLPAFGFVRIGQKTNRRRVDLQSWAHEKIVFGSDVVDVTNQFVDQMFHLDLPSMLTLHRDGELLHVNRQSHKGTLRIDDLHLNERIEIQPNYLIEPNISA